MNAKLIAAAVAMLIAASAHAEQKYGRDSVYVTNSPAPSPTKVTADTATRFGRS
jgi:hypothetical protein